MKHLSVCLKNYRLEAVLAPLFKLLEAAMELLVPLVVAVIVNDGVNGGDKSYILYGCLILVGFGAVGLAFSLTAQFLPRRLRWVLRRVCAECCSASCNLFPFRRSTKRVLPQ